MASSSSESLASPYLKQITRLMGFFFSMRAYRLVLSALQPPRGVNASHVTI